MYSSKMISVLIVFSFMMSLSIVSAQGTDTPQIAGLPNDVQYPFIAKVTTNNVYIRSGKGTAYYACGKANAGDKVTVLGQAFGWAEIVPPEGSYSWIHKNYVDVKESQPTVGVLTGDNVRVWAGSDSIEPMRSSSMQTKLNTGELVELFADQPQGSDYYKIKPPAGAKLTINCEFLEYAGPVAPQKPAAIPPRGDVKPEAPADLPAATETQVPTFGNLPADTDSASQSQDTPKPAAAEDADKTAAAETQPAPDDTENQKACYALAKKIDEEVQKPLTEQNYDAIKEELEKIKEDTTDSKAVSLAQILLERIMRYELAISVVNTLKQQDQKLAEAKEKIQQAHQEELKSVHREADFIYTGILKVSHVYTNKTGQKRYLLQGPDGKILCYAVPVSSEVAAHFESLLGKRVGIQGEVSGDSNALVTLISATGVEPI